MAFPFGLIATLIRPAKALTDAIGLTGKGQKVDKIVEGVADVVDVVRPAVSGEDRQSAWAVIEQVVNEERTDELIDKLVKRVKPKLPVWLRWLPIGMVLDAIFPEIVLGWLKDLLTD